MYESASFPPSINIGDTYSIITAQGTEKFMECVFVEPLPHSQDLIYSFGSITSGATDSGNKITIIEVEGSAKNSSDLSEVAQIRMSVLDDIICEIKLPASQSRFKTRNSAIRIDHNTSPEETEIYIHQDSTIYINATNPTNYTLNQARIAFFGWRIVGRQIDQKQAMSLNAGKKPKVVAATGFSR